jgi:hypothetical protein
MRTDSLHASAAPVFSDHVAHGISSALDRWALRRIHQAINSRSIWLVLCDGHELSSNGTPTISTILIKNRQALYRWLWAPELNFGEAYMFGAVEVCGDLPRTLEEVYRAMTQPARWGWVVPPWGSNDRRGARDNVHRHYDLGNDFYELWLDREMVYTCAYFPQPECSLERAQLAKMDLVCRKLRLQPGERVIEAGCGWGAMALFMARQYGVTVRAFNISAEQIAYARSRAENLRLHYAKTLEHWRKRFNEAADRITMRFSRSFVRAWDLYLAGSQAAFTTGSMQLFQVLFARGTSNAIPWTRRLNSRRRDHQMVK